MVFSRAASSLVVYVSLFHLYFLHLVDSQCPRQFQCGNLGNLSFPLADSSQPGCGLLQVECGDGQNPKIHLDNKLSSPSYDILEKFSTNQVLIRNQLLQELLNDRPSEKRCDLFLHNVSLPHSPSISISFFPNITLFRCDKGINCDEEIPNIQQMKCLYFDIYYPKSNEILPPPNGCSVLQLPRSLRDNSDSLDLFERLGADYRLEWIVSNDCLNCHINGGNCTTNIKNEFRCHKGTIAASEHDLFHYGYNIEY